jgi:hypothetical protein
MCNFVVVTLDLVEGDMVIWLTAACALVSNLTLRGFGGTICYFEAECVGSVRLRRILRVYNCYRHVVLTNAQDMDIAVFGYPSHHTISIHRCAG